MINFNIGGGIIHFQNFQRMINILNFYDISKEEYQFNFFDCPPNCKWEGGRHFRDDAFTKKQCNSVIEYFNNLGYGFNFVFSNNYIDTGDRLGNYYLEANHNKLNGVIIANDTLNEYLKEKYPLYRRIKSITAYPMPLNAKTNKEYFGKYLPDYDLVVAPAEMCTNEEFIQEYKNDFNKIEFLINESCFPYCHHKKLHYKIISICNRERDKSLITQLPSFCILNQKNLKKMDKEELKKLKTLRLDKNQTNYLIEQGATNFKISCRTPINTQDEISRFLFPVLNISENAWLTESFGLYGGGQIDESVKTFRETLDEIIKEYK